MAGDGRTRVVVVDDQLAVAEALAFALSHQPSAPGVVATVAATPGAALRAVAQGCDLAVVGADLGDTDGLELARELRREHREVQVVVVSDEPDPRVLDLAREAGAVGYAAKTMSLAELLAWLSTLSAGAFTVPSAVTEDLAQRRLPTRAEAPAQRLLTDRELQVLVGMANGFGTKEIASSLGVSVNTVRYYCQHVLTKLGAHNRLEAVVAAEELGLLSR